MVMTHKCSCCHRICFWLQCYKCICPKIHIKLHSTHIHLMSTTKYFSPLLRVNLFILFCWMFDYILAFYYLNLALFFSLPSTSLLEQIHNQFRTALHKVYHGSKRKNTSATIILYMLYISKKYHHIFFFVRLYKCVVVLTCELDLE